MPGQLAKVVWRSRSFWLFPSPTTLTFLYTGETHNYFQILYKPASKRKSKVHIHIKATTISGIMFTRSSAGKSSGNANGQTTRRAFRVSSLTIITLI
jgi:hypothetical protein